MEMLLLNPEDYKVLMDQGNTGISVLAELKK